MRVKVMEVLQKFTPNMLKRPLIKWVGRLIIDRGNVPVMVALHKLNVVSSTFEQYECGEIKIENGDIVIDVGAHFGLFTVRAAMKVGPNGLVIAIEPEPKNMEILRKVVEGCGLNNVVCVNKAVGFRRGKARLYLGRTSSYKHSLIYREKIHQTRFVEVDVDTLDNIKSDLGISEVDFVKIDAEGSELDILRGAESTLDSNGAKFSIASYHLFPDGEPEFPHILRFLRGRNMRVSTRGESYIYARGR